MRKPFANLDEVEFTDIEENGYYTSRRAQFSASIGARKLGYVQLQAARALSAARREAGGTRPRT